ncbi:MULTISPECIES: manganese/iron ABC transporter ATP-binding protein [Xenorhabdus]|uniref:Chelated iron transport system membrane protein yfeB n=1 Tax=Xenorhabdus doucetiae TaxID=351671 RepID=A0A068QR41_9GAMM|nr:MULTISPECIES: manganese/iron ABC transporter ATP-binding protein [Xenorhabdus]MBD2785427.1 manganese/iron ABC transporter ATP-binding protein [Xenorhabdus sp. 3]MBD2788848.1 manganese/iron ABC transporter ATP-binding protein [Xenorhabdus sp. DI]MDC9582512.1 manganese/iron ABC transporter ATP-binding protein [Xenorhabdus sp. PR6a]TYP00626.1 manganese/iron transport system ATP-binding protein [Xenorhabdus doucetiae]CDG17458.1 Chelated iron transport system membrane protein yfeB [Xenorhabdus d
MNRSSLNRPPSFGQPHLIVDSATVTYNNGHTAIYDASFNITGGTICALVGMNGSGKSTLFKTIMGLVTPSQGKVTLNDQPIKAALKQNIIAYVPQTEDVDWNFPVLVSDVVMMGRYGKMGFLRRPSKRDHDIVNKALERVGLAELRDRQIGELSGGQKKRAFLARALAQEGRVLLLDEPFTGVDVKTENAIIDLLRDLRDEGHLVLVSTHNLGSVPEFCDHVILINRTVLASGRTENTFTQKNLEMTFGGVLRHINLSGPELHEDDDPRSLTVITDDERAAVFYGHNHHIPPRQSPKQKENQP